MTTARDDRGFTLVELLLVILIIAILAVIVIPAFLNQRAKGEDAEARATIRTAFTALAAYHTDHDTYDATKAELVEEEPALGEASPSLTVSGDAEQFTVAERSSSGTTFTLRRAASGAIARDCSDPGRGLCRFDPDAAGDRW